MSLTKITLTHNSTKVKHTSTPKTQHSTKNSKHLKLISAQTYAQTLYTPPQQVIYNNIMTNSTTKPIDLTFKNNITPSGEPTKKPSNLLTGKYPTSFQPHLYVQPGITPPTQLRQHNTLSTRYYCRMHCLTIHTNPTKPLDIRNVHQSSSSKFHATHRPKIQHGSCHPNTIA